MDSPARVPAVHNVPGSRLGRFLAAARMRQGLSLDQVAARLAPTFTPSLLALIESGQYPVGAEDVTPLVEAYRLDLENLFPGRVGLTVDLGAHRIVSGDHVVHLPAEPSIDTVLVEYLRFVRVMRDLEAHERLELTRLRAADLTELARALDIDGDDVEEMLGMILALEDLAVP